MMRSGLGLLIIFAIVAGNGVIAAAASDSPTITAQGFAMTTTLRARPGQFDAVRVRIEAPARIAKLVVEQGDLVTDLSTTTNRSLFALFGLEKRPMNAYDVTLNFAPYINARLTAPATYRIGITVVDREGVASQAAFTVTVIAEEMRSIGSAAPAAAPRHLEQLEGTFQRRGSGTVESVGTTGLTWVTLEPIDVTIRLRAARADASLRPLQRSSWNDIMTIEDLQAIRKRVSPVPYVDVPAARGGAAGTVIALSNGDGDVLIHLTDSDTAVSQLGTTVTLVAHVRR